ncbi:MAG: hypothetical protein Q9174_003467 [Haloplaca sp. 1 TL-2023]
MPPPLPIESDAESAADEEVPQTKSGKVKHDEELKDADAIDEDEEEESDDDQEV